MWFIRSHRNAGVGLVWVYAFCSISTMAKSQQGMCAKFTHCTTPEHFFAVLPIKLKYHYISSNGFKDRRKDCLGKDYMIPKNLQPQKCSVTSLGLNNLVWRGSKAMTALGMSSAFAQNAIINFDQVTTTGNNIPWWWHYLTGPRS